MEAAETPGPDRGWYRDYYLLTGEHMILTDEGWEFGEAKASYEEDAREDHARLVADGHASLDDPPPSYIHDELNAPAAPSGEEAGR